MIFGHQDQPTQANNNMGQPAPASQLDDDQNPLSVDQASSASTQTVPNSTDQAAAQSASSSPAVYSDQSAPQSDPQTDFSALAAEPTDDTSNSDEPVYQSSQENDNNTTSAAGNDDLLALKQQALEQLSPLVDHLDQSPEERFRTTMMMIQATDNQSLIKGAYEAAQAIPDEKARAQALLDLINEINYFTQHNQADDK